jgi:acetyl-CoA carboxylase biotin carboxyl carrier protein
VSLTARDVAEITRLLEESSFDELYLELDGLKLSLKRGAPAEVDSSGLPAATAGPIAAAPIAPAPAPISATPPAADAGVYDVRAPLLGTFYRAPKPGAPPFVEVGSQTEESTIVGIIEVMKLMNTVRAGVAGAVTEILAGDGALVEYGQPLVRIARAK